MTDLPAFEAAGVACCPADALDAVRARADYVTALPAGAGAVREVCDLLLAARSGSLADNDGSARGVSGLTAGARLA